MKFFQQIGLGLRTYGAAHRFIFKNGLWPYLFIPAVLNVLLIVVLFLFASYFGDGLSVWLSGWIENQSLHFIFGFFLSLVIKLLIFFLYALLYKYLVLILLSPFLALLSERTEEILTGHSFPFVFSVFIQNVIRGISLALRNMLIEFLLVVLFFLLAFIPVINFFAVFLLFMAQSYFYGFSMIDYWNERKQMHRRERILFVRKYKGLAVVNGAVFYLMFWIPIAGWLLAPSYAVVAASLAVNEIDNMNRKDSFQ